MHAQRVKMPPKSFMQIQFLCVTVYNTVTYLGVLFTMELYCTPKSQHTTVKHSQKLFKHNGCIQSLRSQNTTPIEFFEQDFLAIFQHELTFLQSESLQAIGPLAHHNSTSAPSLTCTSPDYRLSSPSML
jgi:hypothetical protein